MRATQQPSCFNTGLVFLCCHSQRLSWQFPHCLYFHQQIPVCQNRNIPWEHNVFSCSLSVSWQLICPPPQTYGSPAPKATVCLLFGLLQPSSPREMALRGINQPMKLGYPWSQPKKVSVPSFLSRSIFFHLCVLSDIWESQLLTFHLTVGRRVISFISKSFFCFFPHKPLQPALMIIYSSALVLSAGITQAL